MKFIPKSLTVGNVAIGVGIVILAPIVLPMIGSILKPVIKAAIKGSMMAYEGVRVAVAEAKESLEDLTAEARSEIDGEPAAEK